MSHHLYAIAVRDEDIKLSDKEYFVRSKQDGFSLISPTVALRHNVQLSMPRVQLSTDYFGGNGTQQATFVDRDNKKHHFSDTTKGGAINMALELLGVQPKDGEDHFDAIGLGKFRNNEALHPPEPKEESTDEVSSPMVSLPLDDYNEILRTLEDMSHWREISKGTQRTRSHMIGLVPPSLDQDAVKEMEVLAQSALKLARKGVLL